MIASFMMRGLRGRLTAYTFAGHALMLRRRHQKGQLQKGELNKKARHRTKGVGSAGRLTRIKDLKPAPNG
jgi:hypothetical protein